MNDVDDCQLRWDVVVRKTHLQGSSTCPVHAQTERRLLVSPFLSTDITEANVNDVMSMSRRLSWQPQTEEVAGKSKAATSRTKCAHLTAGLGSGVRQPLTRSIANPSKGPVTSEKAVPYNIGSATADQFLRRQPVLR